MIKWIKDNRDSIILNSFLLPILLVVAMSISHVVSWYDLGNPISWAIYLSVAIEIFALASVSATSIKMKRGSIWFIFGLVTAIQITGNIFYEFRDINPAGEDFISWMKLIQPLFEDWEVLEHRRFLAAIQGGTLPLMSLTALHFYIKFYDLKGGKTEPESGDSPDEPIDDDIITKGEELKIKKVMEEAVEVGKKREAEQHADLGDEARDEIIKDEPTDLAFTPYEIDRPVSDMTNELVDEHIEKLEKNSTDIAANIAAVIEAKNEEELKKVASESDQIAPDDLHTQRKLDKKKKRDSRESTPIFSKQIDPNTGKFVHKKIDQNYGNS